MYRLGEVEDKQNLYNQLVGIFNDGTHLQKMITTPGGAFNGTIFWFKIPGIWAFLHSDDDVFWCSFGVKYPEENVPVTMDVEINLSRTERPRRGAAVLEGNNLYLAHRGGLGGGRAVVSIENFRNRIRDFAAQDVEGTQLTYFILGPVGGENFLSDLKNYVSECRRLRQEARDL